MAKGEMKVLRANVEGYIKPSRNYRGVTYSQLNATIGKLILQCHEENLDILKMDVTLNMDNDSYDICVYTTQGNEF